MKNSSFTTWIFYSDLFRSCSGSASIIQIRIQQEGSDSQHWFLVCLLCHGWVVRLEHLTSVFFSNQGWKVCYVSLPYLPLSLPPSDHCTYFFKVRRNSLRWHSIINKDFRSTVKTRSASCVRPRRFSSNITGLPHDTNKIDKSHWTTSILS